MFTGNPHVLTLPKAANILDLPETYPVQTSSKATVLSLLQSQDVLQSLVQTLSEEFEAYIKLKGMSGENTYISSTFYRVLELRYRLKIVL